MLLNELISSDIMKMQSQLNPELWHNEKLNLEIVDHLIEIGDKFIEFVGIELDVVDYTLTGSNANYTWTQYSDVDLHIIIAETPTPELRELFTAKKLLWSLQHDITIKGMPVECYVQGQNEPHHSTGIYSLLTNKWLVTPQKIKPNINDTSIEQKKNTILDQAETALLNADIDQLLLVKEKIRNMRKAGLDRAGEWSTENLVFKILRNLGIIDQITDKIIELEDTELSFEQFTN